MSWQPIDTAPKDGKSIWCFQWEDCMGLPWPRYYQAHWVTAGRTGCWLQVGSTFIGNPTNWQPLPAPPEPQA